MMLYSARALPKGIPSEHGDPRVPIISDLLPPVQVVNMQESDVVEQLGVPFVAVNIAVGLSLSMPSVATQIAEALVTAQPFGNLSLVGARSFADVRRVPVASADAVFLGADFCERNGGELPGAQPAAGTSQQQAVLEHVLDILTGTD